MARSYVVSTLYNNADYSLLIAMDWTYGDPAEGVSKGGRHTLSEEAQVSPVGLTQAQLVEILVADLPNTTEEFDASIDAELARKAEEESINVAPAPSEEDGESGAFVIPPSVLP